ncbi:MAG: carbohydrate ABC transporter permease [Bacilli bacterium]|nr:carbohydrate ABC transporter permease [Bacilli bacterium]
MIVRKKSIKPMHLLVYAILILFVLIAILPLYWMWQAAFRQTDLTHYDPFAIPHALTFSKIIQAWTVGRMSTYMQNSLIVAVPRVFLILVLASLAGFSFGSLRWRGRDGLFAFILVGMMIPIQAMIIPIYYNMQRFGMINTYWAMIIPPIGLAMPFSIFMMRSFFSDIPSEIMDSAVVDGCSKGKAWLYIMLPQVKPALVSLLIFQFMWSWNDYLLPMLVVYDDAKRTLPMGLNYFQGKYTMDQALIAAGVTISTLPIIIVYIMFQRSFIQGITAGAVKG